MRKYFIIISPFVFLLILLLKHFHILQGIYGEPYVLVLFAIAFSILIAYVERNANHNVDEKVLHYENLDIVRFVFAIIVLLLHMRPFLGYNDQLDLTFNYIVGRACVPLFFITAGYFCAIKQASNPRYILHYIKKMLPVYLLWSIFYLPLGFEALHNLDMNLPAIALPFAVIIGIFYTGTYYHLWYFPALFLALFVLHFWRCHFSMRSLLIISFILLCLGASETYYGLLPVPLQHFLTTYYFKFFYTTRNFLFFGLFYVSLGYYIGNKKQTFVSYSFLKFLFCCFLMVAEALILQAVDRLDSNILLSCVPLVYYLFITLIHTPPLFSYQPKISLRSYYKYYYLLHPAVIYATAPIFLYYDRFHGHYWIQILIVISCVQLLTVIIVHLKRRFPKALRYL